jgi:hypothetical protein
MEAERLTMQYGLEGSSEDEATAREPHWRVFHDLVDLLASPRAGHLALLSAYFDASRMDDSGVFCVGGFAFGPDRAKKAERAWRDLWGDTICRMSDLHSRKPGSAFENWTGPQAGQRLKDCVRILNRYATYAVCVSCNLSEIEALAPTSAARGSEIYLDGFRRAYAVCCHLAMASLGKVAKENRTDSGIAYVFESGDLHQSESQRFISLAVEVPEVKQMYSHVSHTVVAKPDARLLETADIIAWEWAKHRERLQAGRHMRPSLTAILENGRPGCMDSNGYASASRRAMHVTGQPLARYFDQVREFILS